MTTTAIARIRPAALAEMPLLLDWAAAEGWNPGLSDAMPFHAADPEGFLVAEDEAGEPVSCISAVRHGPGFGFIGFYICRPDRRGQGHGFAIWQEGMRRLSGRLIGLDGVVAQQPNYRKSGFALAWRNIRYAAERPRMPPSPAAGSSEEIRPATDLPLAEVAALDRALFPAPREAFLRAWLTAPGHVARVLLRRDGEGGPRVAGLGVLRPCRQGAKIGPLYAPDADGAAALLAALLPHAPATGPVALDLPEPNAAARALAEAVGMAPVFETARMYAGGEAPPLDPRLFGVASFELG